MRLACFGLLAAVACHSSSATLSPQVSPLPQASKAEGARVPPGCSPMHGGVAGAPGNPARWRFANVVAHQLEARNRGMLVVFADSSVSNNPIQSFILQLSGADVPPRNSISRAPGTAVTIEVPPGRFAVTIREVGF